MAIDLREDEDLKSDINVTPLVDVVLVLLVIFMVVTPFIKQEVPVELPLAESSRQAQDLSQVISLCERTAPTCLIANLFHAKS